MHGKNGADGCNDEGYIGGRLKETLFVSFVEEIGDGEDGGDDDNECEDHFFLKVASGGKSN